MEQLSALQQQLIGGGNEKDAPLKEKLKERKKRAKRRSDKFSIDLGQSEWDDDDIIEGNTVLK